MSIYSTNEDGVQSVRVVSGGEDSGNGKSIYTFTEDGKQAIRVVGLGGGEGGTSNYNELSNKPKINSITLTGNKSGHDLGLMNEPTVVTLTGSTVSISQVEKNKIYVCEDAVTNLTVTDVEDSYIESAIYFCSGDTIHVEIDGVDVIGTTTFKPNKYYIVALVNKTMIVGEKQ